LSVAGFGDYDWPAGTKTAPKIHWGQKLMSQSRSNSQGTVHTLRSVATEPVDAEAVSMIEILQEHLALARAGKLRSLAVVSVSADGGAIGTQWSCSNGDSASLIGKLTVLTHDLMSARE
jgi:hypothetical protein